MGARLLSGQSDTRRLLASRCMSVSQGSCSGASGGSDGLYRDALRGRARLLRLLVRCMRVLPNGLLKPLLIGTLGLESEDDADRRKCASTEGAVSAEHSLQAKVAAGIASPQRAQRTRPGLTSFHAQAGDHVHQENICSATLSAAGASLSCTVGSIHSVHSERARTGSWPHADAPSFGDAPR